MGGKDQQRRKTHWTQWYCHQCGASDYLESDPAQIDVCYCSTCWDSWDSSVQSRHKVNRKGKSISFSESSGGSALSTAKGKTNRIWTSGVRSENSSFSQSSKGHVKGAKTGKTNSKGKSDMPPETCMEDALEKMASKAADVYNNLPRHGRHIWKALKTCIQSTLRAGVVHFERALRAELALQVSDEVNVTRQAGSQWIVTIGDGPRPTVCYASVRSEVLGGQGADLLAELKQAARTVKNTLLDDGASWLHDLAENAVSRREFLAEVQERRQLDTGERGKGKDTGKAKGTYGHDENYNGECCPVCKKSLTQDRLGGKHMCHIIASFKCCSKWTSHAGRYNLEEQRVMGQRCQRCGQDGVPMGDWQISFGIAFGGHEKPHRSELCESCDKYGNCRGAFLDPFQMSMAVETVVGRPASWEAHAGGHVWTTQVRNEIIVLQPHVHVSNQ